LGFGRRDADREPLPRRAASAEAIAVGTGERVLQISVADARPPVPPGEWWRPPEFLAAVDPSGLVGPLVLVGRSGTEEVDNYFRNYLERTLRIGARLRPGFYRICIGP
jgi:hypothetical protein